MKPKVALRSIGKLEHIKTWTVLYGGRSVPFPTYEEAQEWAVWLVRNRRRERQ